MSTNIKYNSNKNESNDQFFENEAVFLFLNDCLTDCGYFAIGEKEGFSLASNAPVDFDLLDDFVSKKETWKFGFLTYDLKNDVEQLTSENKDLLNFPKLHFFIPKTLLKYNNGEFELIYGDENLIEEAYRFIDYNNSIETVNVTLESTITKEEYLTSVNRLQNEIQKGNIYEVNFCYEYFKKNTTIDPVDLYNKLLPLTKAPFSSFGKFNNQYIISASPERFLKKTGNKLVSQPIKGTSKRGVSLVEDERLIEELRTNEKERSENIMIVDLVRNDLSRISHFDSVNVDEFCEIYSFETVHQMISTVSSQLKEEISFSDIIKATYPMGSMTGAPKISAMQLIEQEESTKRGLYSGSVGYIDSNGDFDFNVIIRSFLYNAKTSYLSAMVGGALTAKSSPEAEYEETVIKIAALIKSLQ